MFSLFPFLFPVAGFFLQVIFIIYFSLRNHLLNELFCNKSMTKNYSYFFFSDKSYQHIGNIRWTFTKRIARLCRISLMSITGKRFTSSQCQAAIERGKARSFLFPSGWIYRMRRKVHSFFHNITETAKQPK